MLSGGDMPVLDCLLLLLLLLLHPGTGHQGRPKWERVGPALVTGDIDALRAKFSFASECLRVSQFFVLHKYMYISNFPGSLYITPMRYLNLLTYAMECPIYFLESIGNQGWGTVSS